MRYLTIEQRESLDKALKQRAAALVGEITAALRQADTPESIHLANRFEEVREEALADLELALDLQHQSVQTPCGQGVAYLLARRAVPVGVDEARLQELARPLQPLELLARAQLPLMHIGAGGKGTAAAADDRHIGIRVGIEAAHGGAWQRQKRRGGTRQGRAEAGST